MIRYLTAGESHGKALVGIVEGLPAGLAIEASDIDAELARRQRGYGRGGRMRIEKDTVEILSGVRHGRTLGSPVALLIRNADNERWKGIMDVAGPPTGEKVVIPRAGHVDYAGSVKYAFDDIRNVIERASARETAMRVACSALTRRLLEVFGIRIGSHVVAVGPVRSDDETSAKVGRLLRRKEGASALAHAADASELRFLSPSATRKGVAAVKRARKEGDTLGGVFEVVVTGLPVGLGSYVHFDRKLDGLLAQALMSVHAIKGVEIGMGFANAALPGSEVHDAFAVRKGTVERTSNRAGGLEGGITNGQPIVIRAAMKPISTLAHPLRSVDIRTGRSVPGRYERSDVCAVPAASVIGEAVVAPVIANAFLEKFGGDSVVEIRRRYKEA